MAHDLPGWVAELTDPRRAQTLDELADRLVPLAEHSIDVSRRLQTLLSDLNDPFKREALYGRVERLKGRAREALDEISAEIAASGTERIDRIAMAWTESGETRLTAVELRRRLEAAVVPDLVVQQKAVADQVAERTSAALERATATLLTRVEELAKSVTALIHDVLPLAREGLTLASRISALSLRARQSGRGTIPEEFEREGAEIARTFDEAVARLELEWATLGARSATVRAALRGAEEAAFSHVTQEMTRCVEELAPEHVKVLKRAEARARELFDELTR